MPTSADPASLSVVDPDSLFEVIDGAIEIKRVGAIEVRLAFQLAVSLENFASARGLGRAVTEMLFPTTEGRKRRPDVAYISRERWPLDRPINEGIAWEVVPDLAVEVVSPTDLAIDLAIDLAEKVDEYFNLGVRTVWLVYPSLRKVYTFTNARTMSVVGLDDSLGGGEVLPGFQLALSKLFDS